MAKLTERQQRWLRFNDLAPGGIIGACAQQHRKYRKVSFMDAVHHYEWTYAKMPKVPRWMYAPLQEMVAASNPHMKFTQIYYKQEENYEIIAN